MPDPFTVAGLVSTGIGALGKIFGGGDDAERMARYKAYLDLIQQKKRAATMTALKQSSGLLQQATAGATRRAAASGRAGDTEAYVLPAQTRAIQAGTAAVERAQAPYNAAEIQAGGEFADRPIEPGVFDYLTELGGVSAQYGQDREYLEAMKKYGGTTIAGTQSPTETIKGNTMNFYPDDGGEEVNLSLPRRKRRRTDLQLNYGGH